MDNPTRLGRYSTIDAMGREKRWKKGEVDSLARAAELMEEIRYAMQRLDDLR